MLAFLKKNWKSLGKMESSIGIVTSTTGVYKTGFESECLLFLVNKRTRKCRSLCEIFMPNAPGKT